MIRYFSALSFWIICVLAGCVNKNREEKLNLREKALLEKEKEFALKESDYQSLVRMRDSILALQKDTVIVQNWPDVVVGLWNSKVVCIESSCGNYAVGDVRTDQWEFAYDSARLITKVTSGNKLVRVYNGSYQDSTISLSFSTDSTSAKRVKMEVSIAGITPQKLKGTRTVSVGHECQAVFSVELVKSKTNPE